MGFRYARIGLVLSLSVFCFVFSNQFLAPKKTSKLPSSGKLKEQCGQSYADLLEKIPDLLHAIAELHADAISTIRAYAHGDSNCFGCTDKEKLDKYNSLLNKATELCQNFTSEINAQLSAINSLKNV